MDRYETVQLIQVKSKTLSCIHYSLQFLTIAYVAVYILWMDHGYQKEEKGIGEVSIKVKGTGHTGYGGQQDDASDLSTMKVQDAVDLVYPPKEENAIFLTTNYLDVPRQSRDRCRSSQSEDVCAGSADCPVGTPSESLVGYRTGACLQGACEVQGWCPTEPDNTTTLSGNVLDAVEHFSIFARVSIAFPFSGKTTTNLHAEGETASNELTPGLNVFEVGDVLRATNTSFADVAVSGGIFLISFNWDCNLDHPVSECVPEVDTTRIDDYADPLSHGYNFRYATYYEESGVEYRYLRKAYGLRFLVQSAGRGRLFDWATLIITLGSAFALLGVATVIVDNLALYVLPKRDVYQRIKYVTLDEREEEEKLIAERIAERREGDGAPRKSSAGGGGYGATETVKPMAPAAGSDRR